jgi:hypothetical protein
MAAFQKFDSFVEGLAHQEHDLGSNLLAIYLTNNTPSASADITRFDLAEITVGVDGYTTDGNDCTLGSSGQTAGVYKLVLDDPATWTSTGTLGPFRYAVLYNKSNDKLIGYWDYGVSITLANGETFVVDFSPTSGVLTLV